MEDILLVTNSSAGTNERAALDQALTVLHDACAVEVVETVTAAELDTVVRDVVGRACVVAGGDGSLHAVVNALHRNGALGQTRIGLIPLGTGNDFARGVGIPLDPAEAAEVVAAAEARRIDLVVDDLGTVVVNNVHLGVGAQASREAATWKPRLGRLGYAVGALSAGIRPRFLHVKVVVDGAEVGVDGHLAQVAIGNGSHVGGGAELIPGADPGDGQLVVIVSRDGGRLTRAAYLVRLRGGSHDTMEAVTRVTGTTVEVEGEPFHLVADGEITGPHTRRRWELLPGAMEMFLPPPTAEES